MMLFQAAITRLTNASEIALVFLSILSQAPDLKSADDGGNVPDAYCQVGGHPGFAISAGLGLFSSVGSNATRAVSCLIQSGSGESEGSAQSQPGSAGPYSALPQAHRLPNEGCDSRVLGHAALNRASQRQ